MKRSSAPRKTANLSESVHEHLYMYGVSRIMKHRIAFINLPVLAVFLVLTSTAALASNTWYVDGVNGSDSNNCKTPETACKTIRHAISLSSRGDFIRMAAATYTENVSIPFTLDIIGSDASTTIIDGGSGGNVFWIPTARVVLSNVTVRHGAAQDYGGGIFVEQRGTLTINNSIISDNTVGVWGRGGGGGVFVAGKAVLTINNSTVSGNSAHSHLGSCGGGILNNGGTVTINKSIITGNQANSSGGGICNFGTLTVNNSTVSGNGDGGIYNSGTLTVVKSTMSGNTTSGAGGGITNDGILTITNSTISGNLASGGGGLALFSGKTTISNSTLQGNPSGGGVVQSGSATITLQNSIVADNSGGNCYGSVTSSGYNLSSDNTCNFNSTGDMNNTDPKLGTLGNYGGPTQTIPLLFGSPAIDAGNPNGCTDAHGHLLKTDQRGKPRPDKEDTGGCDMGAYERQKD
jgi:hypothetical protein